MRGWLVLCLVLGAATWIGGAHGALVEGTSSGNVLWGTSSADKMYGYGGADTLHGKSGSDLLVGGSGADTLECGNGSDSPQGNGGEDLVYCDAADGKADVIDCGSEDDIVFWSVPGTVVLTNCEAVFHVTSSGD